MDEDQSTQNDDLPFDDGIRSQATAERAKNEFLASLYAPENLRALDALCAL